MYIQIVIDIKNAGKEHSTHTYCGPSWNFLGEALGSMIYYGHHHCKTTSSKWSWLALYFSMEILSLCPFYVCLGHGDTT